MTISNLQISVVAYKHVHKLKYLYEKKAIATNHDIFVLNFHKHTKYF